MENSPHAPAATWTRRRILGWGSAGAAGSLVASMAWPSHEAAPVTAAKPPTPSVPTAPLPASPPPTATASTREICREDFLPHLQSSFRLKAGVDCTLVEVGAAENHVTSVGQFTCFTLLFKAPLGSAVPSEVHSLLHDKMGAMDLFLSPVGRTTEHLEAVFSQRI